MKKRPKLNIPFPSSRKDKKLMVFVKNPKTGRIIRIHFGDPNYKNNYSKKSWERFQKRSSGIRDGKGRLTKNNKLYANYWARKILWDGKKWKK